jgi:DNA-binding NtrC family response regulator
VVAASNRSIEALVRRGEFRQDLFYRLNVLSLPLPALRERRQDIWHLATHFIARFAAEYGTPRAQLGDAAMRSLLAHDWPGNVRELEHLLERVCLLHAGGQIEAHELGLHGQNSAEDDGLLSFREAKLRTIQRFERDYLEQLLARHQGNVTRAAAAVQKNRRALLELLHRHGIQAQDYRPTAPGRSPRPSSAARPRRA